MSFNGGSPHRELGIGEGDQVQGCWGERRGLHQPGIRVFEGGCKTLELERHCIVPFFNSSQGRAIMITPPSK